MKSTAMRCKCKVVLDPIHLGIVKNAWLDKDNTAHFEFKCPQCGSKNEVTIEDYEQ